MSLCRRYSILLDSIIKWPGMMINPERRTCWQYDEYGKAFIPSIVDLE